MHKISLSRISINYNLTQKNITMLQLASESFQSSKKIKACHCCANNLRINKIPKMASFNQLQPGNISEELQSLTDI